MDQKSDDEAVNSIQTRSSSWESLNTTGWYIKISLCMCPIDIDISESNLMDSVQSLYQLGCWGGGGGGIQDRWFSRDPLPGFLQDTLVSSSVTGRDLHSLMLYIQHLLCQAQHCPPSKVPWRMVLERLSWNRTCSNCTNFSLLTVAEEVPVGSQGSLSCFTPSCWSCAPSSKCGEVSSGTWFWKLGYFSQSHPARSMSHSHRGWRWQDLYKLMLLEKVASPDPV